MSQLSIANCNASGVNTEWDFGTYQYLEEENTTCSPANSTTEDDTEREYVPGTFEGPEKTLEVIFKHGEGLAGGLRNLDRSQLDDLCTQARCTILSKASTPYLDAYVLSESSLFVYDHRLIMKTCGTTTLLRCLGTLFEYADKMGMQLSWVGYSRKNFLFPTAQLWPHVNFGEEMRYIEQHESLQKRLRGDGHILGPVTGDHWFVYVADGSPSASGHTTPSAALYGNASNTSSVMDFRALGLPARASTSSLPTILADADARDARSNSLSTNSTAGDCEEDESGKTSPQPASLPSSVGHSAAAVTKSSVRSTELNTALTQLQAQRHSSYRTFNMMMFDMDPAVAATFFQGTNGLTGKEMTEAAGIPALCPGYQVDEAAFSPCGYSMNAVLGPSYATIHITPEAQCSYVSYETNEALDDYAPLLRRVLATFRPGRFVLTMFGDDDAIDMLPRVPTSTRVYGDIKGCPEGAHYLRTSSTCTTVESQRQQCIMACYTYQQPQAAGVGAEAAV